MSIALKKNGIVVAKPAFSTVQKLVKEDKQNPLNNIYENDIDATMAMARKKLPDVDFDSVEPVDEAAEQEKQAQLFADAEAAQKAWLESEDGKAEMAEQEKDADAIKKLGSGNVRRAVRMLNHRVEKLENVGVDADPKDVFYAAVKGRLMSGAEARAVDAAGVSYPNLSKTALQVCEAVSYQGDVDSAVKKALKALKLKR